MKKSVRKGRLTPSFRGKLEIYAQGTRGVVVCQYGKLNISGKDLNGAMDGDEALCARTSYDYNSAYVIKILRCGRAKVIGDLKILRRGGVVTDGKYKVTVPFAMLGDAEDGDKVVCEVTRYVHGNSAEGKVLYVLGKSGELCAEENAVVEKYRLPTDFSAEVISEAESAACAKTDVRGRRDLRDIPTITIDGEDTRDMDDAVSLERRDGKFILGVHIADVAEYVKEGSALDGEALRRGTSAYFPDRVYPMLPKALSNGACSLNEGAERYALSCVMTFDESGERQNFEIFESVIKSDMRTTYSQIEEVLLGAPFAFKDMVTDMRKLCEALENKLDERGEVNLDIREKRIYIDKNGKIDMPNCGRRFSERIIEQFMIAANEAVADFLTERRAPCAYRVHEAPCAEKLADFKLFLSQFGIKPHFSDRAKPKDFNEVLKAAKKSGREYAVGNVALRTMQRAKYSHENIGHFGLASKRYCHFTSPIRRYPDLFVHRTLKKILRGENTDELKREVKSICEQSSARERVVADCETAVDDLYAFFYLKKRLGEEFTAHISGVTEFGIFCELDCGAEGFIPAENLMGGTYEFYPERRALRRGKKLYVLGDKINVRAESTDFGRKRVLFTPLD